MVCEHDGCDNTAEYGKTECFKHRVSGVGFSFRGGAIVGRKGWNTTKSEWMKEHLGADSEKQLAKRTDVEKV